MGTNKRYADPIGRRVSERADEANARRQARRPQGDGTGIGQVRDLTISSRSSLVSLFIANRPHMMTSYADASQDQSSEEEPPGGGAVQFGLLTFPV